jgi:hypothetical protein
MNPARKAYSWTYEELSAAEDEKPNAGLFQRGEKEQDATDEKPDGYEKII